jgi:outer membrane protein TolC
VATAEPVKLTLEQVTAKALAGPKARMAEDDREAYDARVEQADAARYPRIHGNAFTTVSPKITCDDSPNCTETSPHNFAFAYSGVYGSAQFDITQPLYTFGKIGHARAAARAGVAAEDALADEAAGDLAVDAARAYWGLKLAREVGFMLDDGIEQIGKAVDGLKDRKDLSITDRQRVAVLLAQAKSQRADAAQQERAALAGLRAITGMPDADIDDEPLDVAKSDLDAAKLDGAARPQTRAAKAGAVAADELAAMQESYYWPDIALVGGGVIAAAQGVQDPESAFYNNPYNREGIALVLGLQWTIEPWNTTAKVHQARAEAKKAHDQADLAVIGARYDSDSAAAEVTGAKAKLDAATEGEKAAHTWLAAVLQNEAIGAAEPKDLADAYIAWFQMRAQYDAAIFQWNVALVSAARATGEFRAAPRRPR